jgi:hypothetical protein
MKKFRTNFRFRKMSLIVQRFFVGIKKQTVIYQKKLLWIEYHFNPQNKKLVNFKNNIQRYYIKNKSENNSEQYHIKLNICAS